MDGCVHDPQRIDLQRYLQCLKRAAEEIDLRGYFQWTLTDNFEWAMGYTWVGLIYTDFCTQENLEGFGVLVSKYHKEKWRAAVRLLF